MLFFSFCVFLRCFLIYVYICVYICTYIQLFWIFSEAIFNVLTTQWKQTHTQALWNVASFCLPAPFMHKHLMVMIVMEKMMMMVVLFCLPIHANVSKQFTFETHKSNESEQTEIKGVNRRHRDCSANVMNKTDVNQNSNNRSFLNLSKFHNSLLCLPFMATLPLATKFE